MLDRVPALPVVFVEVDAGWVPYIKEQMDNRWRRRVTGAKASFAKLPSEYIEERFSFTYITDQYALANRHPIGVDRLMWSSDFPHGGATGPTHGGRSTPISPTCPGPSGTPFWPATRSGFTNLAS